MAHGGHQRAGVGQLGPDRHLVARRQRAIVGCRHHQFDPQRVDHRHAQQRPVFHPFARVDVALDHHAGKGAAHSAQRQLGVGDVALFDPHALLAAHLIQALAGHLGFTAGLFDGLVGHEALRHQRFGAAHLLVGQVQASLGGQDVGVDARTGVGGAGVGAFDVGAQGQQGLTCRHDLATFDVQAFDHTDHLRTDLGHAVGLDQATQ